MRSVGLSNGAIDDPGTTGDGAKNLTSYVSRDDTSAHWENLLIFFTIGHNVARTYDCMAILAKSVNQEVFFRCTATLCCTPLSTHEKDKTKKEISMHITAQACIWHSYQEMCVGISWHRLRRLLTRQFG